ncbi:TlyA family RNA methyltransferase [Ruminococcus sp. HUN007]|uniref:TlyA family RNA methyltransferase n=1 Tax=Ruminococcus sp. HUN007 TaxID=1514668 RepID=UPI0005D2B7CE|nr:TlyA family RNA methyltransferase [Ruminococcus sp. HUN007]
MSDNRLDVELFERGLCRSRERARQLIKNGFVTVDGRTCAKPAFTVTDENVLEVTGEDHSYVGRGGLKLEKAVSAFEIDLKGRVCLDIGASTGGFTEVMLSGGAAEVYALDVGHGQLAPELASDERVVNMENTNIRETVVNDFKKQPDFIATDVSFISLKLVLPKIKEILSENGEAVVLIKPQFEAGKSNLNKKGVVKDPKVHRQVISDLTKFASVCGFCVSGICVSPIKGGTGNAEYLMYLKHTGGNCVPVSFSADELVREALGKEK